MLDVPGPLGGDPLGEPPEGPVGTAGVVWVQVVVVWPGGGAGVGVTGGQGQTTGGVYHGLHCTGMSGG